MIQRAGSFCHVINDLVELFILLFEKLVQRSELRANDIPVVLVRFCIQDIFVSQHTRQNLCYTAALLSVSPMSICAAIFVCLFVCTFISSTVFSA